MPLEFLFRPIRKRLVVRATFGEAHFPQHLLQGLLVELLGTDKLDVGDGRALLDDHHHHVSVDFETNVLEQAQREQRPNGGRTLFIVVGITDTKRQGGKYRTRLHSLQSLDADVTDRKRIDGPRVGRKRECDQCH